MIRHCALIRAIIMGNLTVAVLGTLNYAEGLAKRGTSTDITLYNLKKSEDTVTFIEPTRFPERLAPLFFSVSLAKKAIVVVDEINSTLGECLVMLQCANVTSGYVVLRNYLPKEKIEPLIKGTILEKYEVIKDDIVYLREQLLEEASKIKTIPTAAGSVPIDHAFNVKGIGTVILGVVAFGEINKHDLVKVMPSTKTTQIRSIQKHDDEFDKATEGDRVGLALKNINVQDVDRGTVLTTDPAVKITKTIQAQASLVKYWQIPLKQGMILHIGHWMQFITCKIEAVTETADSRKPQLTLNLEKDLVYNSGDNVVITYLEGGKLRVIGTLRMS
jgi:selenocysteine-specific translation elongation factor